MSTQDPQWGQSATPVAVPKRSKKHLIGYPVVALVCLGIGSAAHGSSTPVTATADTSATTTTVAGKTVHKAAAKAAVRPAAKSGPGVGDAVRDGKFRFTVTKIRKGVKSVGDNYAGAKAQGQFVLVYVKVANIGTKPQTLDGDAQEMYDARKRKFDTDTDAAIYLPDSNTLYTPINPGNSVKGILVFDIPKTAVPVKLELHDSIFSGGADVALK